MMRILIVHNHYQQPGGEDKVFETESNTLQRKGHSVLKYSLNNDQIPKIHPAGVAIRTVWSRESHKMVRHLVKKHKIDVVHVHNTLPLISASVYYAAQVEGAAVVQTLHNYRYACPAGTNYLKGTICQRCTGKFYAYPAVLNRCYRGSRLATAVLGGSYSFHRILGTYQKKIDRFIALSSFTKEMAIKSGLPKEKISVKPNFLIKDPGTAQKDQPPFALFIGRLSPEKGIGTLLEAFSRFRFPLKIIGTGPEQATVEAIAGEKTHVKFLGKQPHHKVLGFLKRASFLVVPSVWHEPFGLVLIESFACGTPVVASRIGSLQSIVETNRTGLLYEPGNVDDLIECIQSLSSSAERLKQMAQEARKKFLNTYTAEANYPQLLGIYEEAIQYQKFRNSGCHVTPT